MRSLGRIFVSLSLFVTLFFAVDASVDKDHILRGESVTLKLSAEGEEAVFPKITQIGGFEIDSVSNSKSEITNKGKVYRFVSKYYTFTPLNDVEIPSYTIKVDGKEFKTKPIKISVKSPPSKSFDLEMYSDKKEVYVGEPLRLTIVFRKKIGVNLSDVSFNPPSFLGFWAKELQTSPKEIVGSFVVQKIEYVLFPQREGEIEIDRASLDITSLKRDKNDEYSYQREKKRIFSNSLKIDVKPLPLGVRLFGKFSLKANVDKRSVKAGEAVNLTIRVEGEGNIEDIDEFSLDIPFVTVYKERPKIVSDFRNGRYGGSFSEKFSLIAKKDFTIPSFSLAFFDKDRKERVVLKTEPIDINVTGGGAKESKIERFDRKREEDVDMKKLVLLSIGTFIIGVLIGFLLKGAVFRKKRTISSIQKRIKSAKDDKELLKILLPFVERSKEIEEIVFALEANVYNGGGYKVDRKRLVKNIDKYLKGSLKKEEFEELI
ncbi:MAG: protein BatD [Epsilonproteobacteria bacterium]|nr:protein BatD [Campylobacterota bacterium]